MSSELKKGAETAVKVCLNIKKGEKTLIITDPNMDSDIPLSIFRVAKEITDDVEIVSMEPLSRNGEEPSDEIAKLMKSADILFLVTSKSLSHTKARRDAKKAGARIASMPGVIKFSFTKGGLTADYNEVKELCLKMKNNIYNKKEFRVTSDNGTDLIMKCGDFIWDVDGGLYHNPGDFGNLPAGEVSTAPNEGSANGVLVVDKIDEFDSKIKMVVKKGFVTEIEGPDKFKETVENVGEKARNIAELGIGCNKKAEITGNVLEDEKVFGTVHIAIGNNISWGGNCDVPLHLDGIILKPSLEADGKVIIKKGEWLI